VRVFFITLKTHFSKRLLRFFEDGGKAPHVVFLRRQQFQPVARIGKRGAQAGITLHRTFHFAVAATRKQHKREQGKQQRSKAALCAQRKR